MSNTISILGSTGSIGRQTLAVAENRGIKIAALTANNRIDLLEDQARRFHPEMVAVYDDHAASELKIALRDTPIKVLAGMDGLIEAAVNTHADCIVTAVSGAVGLKPTMAALDCRKRIALANKETLVCAGSLVMQKSKDTGAEIIPVDSEHSAIFQCLMGRKAGELNKILLTGSGGPFRGKKWKELTDVTPEQAVKHPKWNMGAKISVDSATMMNKGLEFIEAMHLFSVTPEKIQIVVHPQSIVHSMVELIDGTVIAQLGVPDMGLPIQLALTYPERCESMFNKLDFYTLGTLTFEEPSMENTPCLALAMNCAGKGGNSACVMSAANEVAVHKFLKRQLGYNQIYDAAASAVENVDFIPNPTLDELLESDAAARRFVMERFPENL